MIVCVVIDVVYVTALCYVYALCFSGQGVSQTVFSWY